MHEWPERRPPPENSKPTGTTLTADTTKPALPVVSQIISMPARYPVHGCGMGGLIRPPTASFLDIAGGGSQAGLIANSQPSQARLRPIWRPPDSGPLRGVFGVSDKVLTMALYLLIGARGQRPVWFETGKVMVAIDTLSTISCTAPAFWKTPASPSVRPGLLCRRRGYSVIPPRGTTPRSPLFAGAHQRPYLQNIPKT